MNIKEVSASYGRKMSDNNYGSRDVFFSLTADIEPTEDAAKVQHDLFELCHEAAMQEFSRAGNGEVEPPKATSTIPTNKPFDWKDTPGGQRWLDVKAEDNDEHGAENGPRGGQFEGESVSGQQ